MLTLCKYDLFLLSWGNSSVAGPDGIPASLLLNCASELAPSHLNLFKQSLDSGVIDPSLKKGSIDTIFSQMAESLIRNLE